MSSLAEDSGPSRIFPVLDELRADKPILKSCDNNALHSRLQFRGNAGRSLSCRRIDSSIASKMVTNEKRQALRPTAVIESNGEPSRARTCDPLIKSAFTGTPAGYGSYHLLTSVTACSRQRV